MLHACALSCVRFFATSQAVACHSSVREIVLVKILE